MFGGQVETGDLQNICKRGRKTVKKFLICKIKKPTESWSHHLPPTLAPVAPVAPVTSWPPWLRGPRFEKRASNVILRVVKRVSNKVVSWC